MSTSMFLRRDVAATRRPAPLQKYSLSLCFRCGNPNIEGSLVFEQYLFFTVLDRDPTRKITRTISGYKNLDEQSLRRYGPIRQWHQPEDGAVIASECYCGYNAGTYAIKSAADNGSYSSSMFDNEQFNVPTSNTILQSLQLLNDYYEGTARGLTNVNRNKGVKENSTSYKKYLLLGSNTEIM
ncbi:hypothetical protein ARMGADRAFT_1034371 [Armillaria gallica]|uniref:Uncharacterized protein n=1 Tax=Armillaria gallica TaxID=47427 RepID=A0A2H3CYI2_ARMGA|nr:hypothetical protein ARMGADRAFT_1034371 [Armillaria gallica]